MGLFSFLKKAGTNLFGKSDEEKRREAERLAAELNAKRIGLLKGAVHDLNLPIDNMSLELQDDTVVVYGQTSSQAIREKVILALGNVEGIACVDDRISVTVQETEAQFYEVKSGDTLSKIAKEYYGDAMKYPTIFEANKPMLDHPDKIYPGQVLRIPPLNSN